MQAADLDARERHKAAGMLAPFQQEKKDRHDLELGSQEIGIKVDYKHKLSAQKRPNDHLEQMRRDDDDYGNEDEGSGQYDEEEEYKSSEGDGDGFGIEKAQNYQEGEDQSHGSKNS